MQDFKLSITVNKSQLSVLVNQLMLSYELSKNSDPLGNKFYSMIFLENLAQLSKKYLTVLINWKQKNKKIKLSITQAVTILQSINFYNGNDVYTQNAFRILSNELHQQLNEINF